MDTKKSCEYFARKIIKNGELSLKKAGMFLPSDYFKNFKKSESNTPDIPEYYRHSDVLINELDVTHYTIGWKEFPNVVSLKLYRAEALGACDVKERDFIKAVIVDLSAPEIQELI